MATVTPASKNSSKTAQAAIGVTYVALSEVQRWPRNPKKHDLPRLKASIVRHGFTVPLIRDERTGRLVAGHGRLEALQSLKDEGAKAPARVLVKKGEWHVPVITGVEFASEKDAEDYLLSDNRLTELGGWDTVELVKMLRDDHSMEEIAAIGWSESEMRRLASEVDPVTRGKTPNDLLDGFNAGVIKQVVLYFQGTEFDEVQARIEKVMAKERVDNVTEAFLKILAFYEDGHR
jgi:hypothetical protein